MALLVLNLHLCLWTVFLFVACHSQTTNITEFGSSTQKTTLMETSEQTTQQESTQQESTQGTTEAPSTSVPSETSESLSPTEKEPATVSTHGTVTDPESEGLTTAIYIVIGAGALIVLTVIVGVVCVLCQPKRADETELLEVGPTVSAPYHGAVEPEALPAPLDPTCEPDPFPVIMAGPSNDEDMQQIEWRPTYANVVGSEPERVESSISFSEEEDENAAEDGRLGQGATGIMEEGGMGLEMEQSIHPSRPVYANLPNNQRERVASSISVSDEEDAEFRV